MTPEELDEARAKEAVREMEERNTRFSFLEAATIAARKAREGWTPPVPVVDPDILAWRELAMTSEADDSMLAKSFVYGARMAREQERERAKVLVEFVENQQFCFDPLRIAPRVLAKYRGEA